jgi:hypothetical protein
MNIPFSGARDRRILYCDFGHLLLNSIFLILLTAAISVCFRIKKQGSLSSRIPPAIPTSQRIKIPEKRPLLGGHNDGYFFGWGEEKASSGRPEIREPP